MGYDNMDHGGWVQNNIDAVRKRKAKLTKRDQIAQANRKGWHSALSATGFITHRLFGTRSTGCRNRWCSIGVSLWRRGTFEV